MLDPIADMLTRIRNAQLAGHVSVTIPLSKLKYTIAQILVHEGFVARLEKGTEEVKTRMTLFLKYKQIAPTKKMPAISEIEQVSKQGRRRYVKKHEIAKVKNGYGIAIVSTSRGVMTGLQAYRSGLGGEYICKVW